MMNASEVMTRNLITISPDASVLNAIRLMLQQRISGLPVVDSHGMLVGIVTEGDLLRRNEIGTQKKRPQWMKFLVGPGRLSNEYVHSSGRRVDEVMSPDVHSISEDTSLADIVHTMEHQKIKRLPVLKGGKLVGIVSRSNLLRALATVARETKPTNNDDKEIRRLVTSALGQQSWVPSKMIEVIVRNGVVHLWGTILDERERRGIRVVAENTAGVKAVEDHLVWVEPMSGLVMPAPDEQIAAQKTG